MKSRRRLWLVVAAILALLFVVRPGANGLRKRIVSTVGMALGRRVEVQWVKLRVLPQPGFDLENFIVYDDPAFGAEPMLRADEVTANLRLRSMLRGRLEIGRLSLKEPSFNLVRADNGHWNIEALLERVAHTPAAPTSHTRPERRPVFPYIEADNGRINFKIGAEKKSYSLTDADFALWLESENQWGMRVAARPIRTDFNLSDTGILRAEGTWQRSGSLRETPLKFSLEWERAQLGQFTKLISGRDKGWRGGVRLSSMLSGTPADLSLMAEVTIDDFRRYDIVSPDALRLSASCTAHYSSIEHAVSNLLCQSPLPQGTLVLAGTILSPTGPRSYDLALHAQDIPVQPLVSLARHAKHNLSDDLVGKGELNAEIRLQTVKDVAGSRNVWSGDGAIDDLRLISTSMKSSLTSERVPFKVSSPTANNPRTGRARNQLSDQGSRINFGPFNIALGGSSQAKVSGWSGDAGYSFQVQTESQVQRLLQAAQVAGFPVPPLMAEGAAKLNFDVSGSWVNFAPPVITGTAQLRSVRAEVAGVGPFQITSANVSLADGNVRLQNLFAIAAGSHWTGALTFPLTCTGGSCRVQVGLAADAIYFDRFRDWLNPRPRKKPWYRMLASSKPQADPLLKSMNATGTVSAGRLILRGLEATGVSAQLELRDGLVKLKDLRGTFLGGDHVGDWQADLQATPPTYSGSGRFDRISLAELAQAMHTDWITGTGNGSYRFSTSGANASEAVKSAACLLDFSVLNAHFPHVALDSVGPPLQVRRFSGQLSLKEDEFKIEESKLETTTRTYQVSGTATFGQKLNLKLTGNGLHGFSVTGTLSDPRVLPANTAETQAALKP